MAWFVPSQTTGHITVNDIVNASGDILSCTSTQGFLEGSRFVVESESIVPGVGHVVSDIGIKYNKWRRPVREFGPRDGDLEERISRNEFIRDFEVDQQDWARSVKAINILLENVLLKELQKQAENYEGLSFKKYVKQGSSREGLKIRKADEFDTVLLFDIKGLSFEHVPHDSQPGLGFLRVSRRHSVEQLAKTYPRLMRDGIFKEQGTDIYLNSRKFHERVFESLIDSAKYEVKRQIDEANSRGEPVVFDIKRQLNPPSVNLTFIFKSNVSADVRANAVRNIVQSESRLESGYSNTYQIDVDVVPGLQINLDTVPNPFNPRETMDCPVYAVFKWRNENQRFARAFKDPEVIWRFCTSGYEKHIMDVAQTKRSQRYIMTACRIVKAYVKSSQIKPTQFGHMMKSYFLKNIALYCILYLTVINNKELSGVKEALGYFIDFLEISLEETRLPHFFYCNEWLKYMFPDYELVKGYKVNLYESALKSGTLMNARGSQWKDVKCDLQQLCQYQADVYADFKQKFREFIQAGEYCQMCPD